MKEFTISEINAMNPEEYKENYKNPEFLDLVNRLYKPQADVPQPDAVPADVVASTEVPAPATVVKEYRYQPTDEQGRKLGGEQVLKYKTEQELAEKLRDQNILLVRKLREVTRKQTLGIIDEEVSNLPKFEGPLQLSSRDLPAEERFQIAQDLQDPEKFNSGRDRLLESAFGVKPETLRERINSMEQRQIQQDALNNYTTFLYETPEYTRNPDNDQNLTAYMVKHELPPTVEGFKYAYAKVKTAGLLVDTPPVQEATVLPPAPVAPAAETVVQESQTPAVTPTRIGQDEQPQTKRQVSVPSGLNNRTSSGTTQRSEGITLTLRDINRMTPEQYKVELKNPAFRTLVDTLEKEAADRRRAKLLSV